MSLYALPDPPGNERLGVCALCALPFGGLRPKVQLVVPILSHARTVSGQPGGSAPRLDEKELKGGGRYGNRSAPQLSS